MRRIIERVTITIVLVTACQAETVSIWCSWYDHTLECWHDNTTIERPAKYWPEYVVGDTGLSCDDTTWNFATADGDCVYVPVHCGEEFHDDPWYRDCSAVSRCCGSSPANARPICD